MVFENFFKLKFEGDSESESSNSGLVDMSRSMNRGFDPVATYRRCLEFHMIFLIVAALFGLACFPYGVITVFENILPVIIAPLMWILEIIFGKLWRRSDAQNAREKVIGVRF